MKISKGIVNLHNGIVGVKSDGLGKGSSFYVDLPVYLPINSTTPGHQSDRSAVNNSIRERTDDNSDGYEGWRVGSNKDHGEIMVHDSGKTAGQLITLNSSAPVTLDENNSGKTETPTTSINTKLVSYTPSSQSYTESGSGKTDTSVSLSYVMDKQRPSYDGSLPPENGSGKSVSLPIHQLVSDSDAVPNRPRLESFETGSREGTVKRDVLSVLVVDDSGLSRKMMCKLLQSLDFHYGDTVYDLRVEEASDGIHCIDMILDHYESEIARRMMASSSERSVDSEKSEQRNLGRIRCFYDIIFLDYHMPNCTGPETIQKLFGLADFDQHGMVMPYIIGLSGVSDSKEISIFKDAGAKQILLKPVDTTIVCETLTKYLVDISSSK